MNHLFTVGSPEQLKELLGMMKESSIPSTRAERLARVWTADRRRNHGKSACDGKVLVGFCTDGNKRHACIVRADTSQDMQDVAVLKYQPALQWCKKHLEAVCNADKR